MEKISKLILILCVLSTKYYCSELIPHTTYHANGNVKWSGTIDSLTGKKEGAFKEFTRYGKLLIQGSYKNDEREGQWKSFYHQSDQLYDIGSYKAGDYIGEWKYFHRNGQIRKIGSYYEYSNMKGSFGMDFVMENGSTTTKMASYTRPSITKKTQ